jgi:hypothetical protein
MAMSKVAEYVPSCSATVNSNWLPMRLKMPSESLRWFCSLFAA